MSCLLLAIGKIGSGIVNLSLLVSQVTKVAIRKYKSHATLRVHRLGPSHVSKQNVVSYSFDSMNKAYESKEGHL